MGVPELTQWGPASCSCLAGCFALVQARFSVSLLQRMPTKNHPSPCLHVNCAVCARRFCAVRLQSDASAGRGCAWAQKKREKRKKKKEKKEKKKKKKEKKKKKKK